MKSLKIIASIKLSTIIMLCLFVVACGGPIAYTNTSNAAIATQIAGTLSATSTSIPYNSSTTITWSSANTIPCTFSGDSSTGVSGSFYTPRLTITTIYTLTCGSTNQSITIKVSSAAVASAITHFAAGTGNVMVSSLNTLTNGILITISGTTNYNRSYTVSNVTPTSFTIVETFNGDDATGVWQLAGGMLVNCQSSNTSIITLNYAPNSPSRFTGVAPLSVFFDASGTTSTTAANAFHDFEYRWDFDDYVKDQNGNYILQGGSKELNLSPPIVGTSTWNMGSKPGTNSRNTATGPVASHVYETPGIYTVLLTAYDGTNKASNSCAQIVVQDPNTVFSRANTICVGASTTPVQGQDGCPVGANTVQMSNFATAISSYAKTGTRLLFKHDDKFTESQAASLSAVGPITLGKYGIGANPKIQSTATGITNIITLGAPTAYTTQDWRVMDLELDGQSHSNLIGFGVNGNADQFTLLRINAHDMGDGIMLDGGVLEYYMSANSYTEHMFDQFTVADSTFNTFLAGYGFLITANHLSLLGTIVNDATAAQHVVRIMHSANGVISNNTFSNPALTKQTFTLRGLSVTNTGICCEYLPNLLPGNAAYTSQTVVSDNHFIAGLSNQPVTVGPSDPNAWDARFKDIIFERNWYAGAGTNCCIAMLTMQTQDTTVRNELIDMTGGGSHLGIAIGAAGTNSINSDNVRLYNNTIFSNEPVDFSAVRVQVGPTNITVINNLAYSPNVSGYFINPGWGIPTTASNNTNTTNTSPLLTAVPPATAIQFKPNCIGINYPCSQGAPVPVWSDFLLRYQTSTRDLGALIH